MSANKQEIEMHIIFQGNVQGVGFRYTAEKHAQTHGIKGTARNLPDGTVEIHALGNLKAINSFIDSLGADFNGYITNISREEVSPSHRYPDFRIVR